MGEECGVDGRLKIGAKSCLRVVMLGIKEQNDKLFIYAAPRIPKYIRYPIKMYAIQEEKVKVSKW